MKPELTKLEYTSIEIAKKILVNSGYSHAVLTDYRIGEINDSAIMCAEDLLSKLKAIQK